MSSFPDVGNVCFSLRGTTYQNNSIVTLEDIGEEDDALLCKANGSNSRSNWFFPNGTRVPSNDNMCDFYRTRGEMVVRLNRGRGGEEGIYYCEILESMNVTLTIYIGVYTVNTSTGE